MTGRHTVGDQYYRLYRARRLTWIIPTLKDSKEIYFMEFITAYPMFDYFDLLQYMERWQPYEGEIKRPGV